jgi:hypothetical protein
LRPNRKYALVTKQGTPSRRGIETAQFARSLRAIGSIREDGMNVTICFKLGCTLGAKGGTSHADLEASIRPMQ